VRDVKLAPSPVGEGWEGGYCRQGIGDGFSTGEHHLIYNYQDKADKSRNIKEIQSCNMPCIFRMIFICYLK
jgi:hypothetical protein